MRVNATLLPTRNLLSSEEYRQVKRIMTPDLRSLYRSMTKEAMLKCLVFLWYD